MNTADRLKLVREKTGLSQTKFGESLGTNQGKIKDIELGKQRISPELAEKIEEVYNIDFRWILTGKGEMFVKNKIIDSLEEIKNKYDLDNKELEFLSEFLSSPEKRKSFVKLLENIKELS